MNKVILFFFTLACCVTGCTSSRNTHKLIVASEMGDCVGVAPQKCLLVRQDAHSDWEYFYTPIDGFTYEPGYEYVILVRSEEVESVSMPADRPAIRYTLEKIVSRTKKESEDLPQRRENE